MPRARANHRRSPRALKVTYTEEAVADIVQAITYLRERNPTAAANLDAEIAQCIARLADREQELCNRNTETRGEMLDQ